MEGYRSHDSGEVTVLGMNPLKADRAWRERIGVVFQSCRLRPQLTVRETLELFAGYYAKPRNIDETLSVVGLSERPNVKVGTLSGGQQRRLDVAVAIIGDPELIFLDEPTTGFDPLARRNAWGLIKNLRDLGKTIFLTTHFMDEAEDLADRIAIIVKGKIIAEGTSRELIAHIAKQDCLIQFSLPTGVKRSDLPSMITAGIEDDRDEFIKIRVQHVLPVLAELTQWAKKEKHDLSDLEVKRPDLEDVYLQLTGTS
jgi:ABC-2 type transport system ATP-binding protein